MRKPLVTFVVNKELDIANHFIGLRSYKGKMDRGFQMQINQNYENLMKLGSEEEIKKEIEKDVDRYYLKEEKLLSLVSDINNEWAKIEESFIKKLEDVHKKPFPYESLLGVISSDNRFGYNLKDGWFATSMFRNKFMAIDIATHELMHFMFHRYYDKVCEEKGLSKNQMWDAKEAFTVLLNLEFMEFRFQPDGGYAPHAKLRGVISELWRINKDFAKTLESAVESLYSGKD